MRHVHVHVLLGWSNGRVKCLARGHRRTNHGDFFNDVSVEVHVSRMSFLFLDMCVKSFRMLYIPISIHEAGHKACVTKYKGGDNYGSFWEISGSYSAQMVFNAG